MQYVHYQLVRATAENGLFARLKSQWAAELGEDDSPEDFYGVFIKHAESIASETPQDARYGIYVLVGDDGSMHGLVHVNHKLPNTSAAEVRLVWTLLAPKYMAESIDLVEFGGLMAGFINGGIELARTEMRAQSMKMLVQNPTDRQYAATVAAVLQSMQPTLRADVRAGWLHVDNIQ